MVSNQDKAAGGIDVVAIGDLLVNFTPMDTPHLWVRVCARISDKEISRKAAKTQSVNTMIGEKRCLEREHGTMKSSRKMR